MTKMKAHWPTFGSYLVLHNAESNGYPWRECIKTALEYSDKVYILEVDSCVADVAAIYDEFKDEKRIVMKRLEGEWDMDDMTIVGRMKQIAREMVQEEYCIYLDADEILSIKSRDLLVDLVLNNSHADVFAVPYITFFGDPYHIANFSGMENFWRWKIMRNLPHIGHGIHGAARKYDENGKLYMDKTLSDGCEIINMNTLEVMNSILFMPQHYIQAGGIYGTIPQSPQEHSIVSQATSEVMNQFPIVCLHYGWVDFIAKAQNGLNYWTKTKAFKTGVEHSKLFDGLDEANVDAKVAEWSKIDRIKLQVKSHPAIMKPHLELKTKILNICQDGSGAGGVAKWGRLLHDALGSDYDVQTFSFNDHTTQVPPNAKEFHKAESFMQYLKSINADEGAEVIFADGFWGATYDGPAKLVSVIHGLWHHPLREKYGDDGLLEERKILWEYQLAYYQKAKELGHILVSISPLVHQLLLEDYGIESILISNSIDLDFYDKIQIGAIETDRPLILHGIKTNHKGLDILPAIENNPLIKDKFDIGTIDEIAEAGSCDKAATFKASDVALIPSKWEASSYLLLECLANNLPIVALRAGILHCRELKHLDNIGIILDEYDADKFAEALVEVYTNSHKYKCGRLFLQENDMTLNYWNDRMKQFVKEVL